MDEAVLACFVAGVAQHGRDFSVTPYFPRYPRPDTMERPNVEQAMLDVIDADDFPVAAFLLQLEKNIVWGTVPRDTDGEIRCVHAV